MPSGSNAVTRYDVYVREAGSPHGSGPHWSGSPAPVADGSLSALVTFTPASSGTNYFAVVAVSSTGVESELSGELPTGTPNPCRADRCSSKTSCDFGTYPDGVSCDDASFCNGAEVCLAGACSARVPRNCDDGIACTVDLCEEAAGQCVHVGPPGCCAACDVRDPCLADACAHGDCSAGPGTEIAVKQMLFRQGRSRVKLAARGTFPADRSLDPTLTGVVVELHGPDGVVLFASSITGPDIKAAASGRQYRFVARRTKSDPLANGLKRLELRRKGSTWRVSAKAETAELADAFLEPTLTWVIRLGTTCVRRLDIACEQGARRALCR